MNGQICPICQNPLDENDRLVFEWVPYKRWFVLLHIKDVDTRSIPGTAGGLGQPPIRLQTSRPWCSLADHTVTHEARDAMRKFYAAVPDIAEQEG